MRGHLGPLVIAVAVLFVATPAGAVTRAQGELTTVKIFAPRHSSLVCGSVLPLKRVVQRPNVLTAAMRDLVAGPTPAERKRGYRGFFSATTANTVRRVVLKNGVASIDFADFSTLIPNAASSCGSMVILAQLDRTARQFPAVKRAIYSFEGSRRAFYEWLQRPVPPGR
jgi:spore germination protein GerM